MAWGETRERGKGEREGGARGPTLEEAARLFSDASPKEGSRREYWGVLRALLRHLEGEGVSRCSELSWAPLLSYQATLRPLSPTTRHHRLLLTRQFLRFLGGCQFADPKLEGALRLQPPPPHRPRPALPLSDQLRLISCAKDRRTRLLCSSLLATGARPGELLSCDLGSLEQGQLRLRGKTGERWVPLPGALDRELGEERRRRRARGEGERAPLFVSRQGRLSRRRLGELVQECALSAGIPHLSPHELRHAACARWLRSGVPLLLVSQLLGHARPSTTLDHYASIVPEDLERGLKEDPLARELGGEEKQPREPG